MQWFKTVCFKGVQEVFFKLGHKKLTTKKWLSILYSFVTALCKQICINFNCLNTVLKLRKIPYCVNL